MRREWSATIKTRNWAEFEKLARTEPDQILCDTVAELARGFTEKADKKALKKVLWILEKAGYEPAESDEPTEIVEHESVPPVAFMSSADAAGETPVTYGYFDGNRFRWLTVYLHELEGIVRASDESMSREEGLKRADVLRQAKVAPFESAEVDPAFVLSRIKRGLEIGKNHRMPVVMAHWRTVIDKASDIAHPSNSIEMPKKLPKEPGDVLFLDPLMAWRIEFGSIMPVLEKMSTAIKEVSDEEAKKEATRSAKDEATGDAISESIVRDHAMRLRDLAWLLHLQGDPAAIEVMGAALDLEKRKGASHYAKRLIDKTIVMYFQLMKKQDSETNPA